MLTQTQWTFDTDDLSAFEFATTKKTPAGKWVVRDGALVQTDRNATDGRFAMAILKESSYKDLTLSVRAKPVEGEVDRAAGLVWRYRDSDNYYVARSNALEKNVRLYRVVVGKRIQFAGKENVELKSGEWHTLKIAHKGAEIAVFLDGEKLFEAKDETFAEAGKIGVWIKSDSLTWFDNLKVEP